MSDNQQPTIDMHWSPIDIQHWHVVPFYQPIQNLVTREVQGFETLARLRRGTKILQPSAFLSSLTAEDLISLFEVMLTSAIRLFDVSLRQHPHIYVSINVEYSVMMREEFHDRVQAILAGHPRVGRRLVIEVLEQEPISDRSRMHTVLARLKRLGFTIALDDIGSAYSSLLMIKELPIDILKLDQAFARDLHRNPDNMLFVLNMLSLSRSLGRIQVVEGSETAEVSDALTILGVEYAQGYAIARPMPAEKLRPWLKTVETTTSQPRPHTLLGCYAAHLLFVEACRFCVKVPFQIRWSLTTDDPYLCAIGRFFTQANLHETSVGRAHKHFHEVVESCHTISPEWQTASDAFRFEMKRMMATKPLM